MEAVKSAVTAPLPTRDLCARAGISRNVLTRLRAQYADRIPAPLQVGSALAWPPEAVEGVRAIVAEEERSRGWAR